MYYVGIKKLCNIWKTTDFSDELSLSQIKELISKPYFNDLDTISITGGEPFLRKDLTEIIKLAKNILPKLKRIFLNTNAYILLDINNSTQWTNASLYIDGKIEKLGSALYKEIIEKFTFYKDHNNKPIEKFTFKDIYLSHIITFSEEYFQINKTIEKDYNFIIVDKEGLIKYVIKKDSNTLNML